MTVGKIPRSLRSLGMTNESEVLGERVYLAGTLEYCEIDDARVTVLHCAERPRPAHNCAIDGYEDVEREAGERDPTRAREPNVAPERQRFDRGREPRPIRVALEDTIRRRRSD